MSESLQIDRFLTAKFKNDAIIQSAQNQAVANGRIPTGAKFPLILFNFQAGGDYQGAGKKRLLASPLYQIKVVQKGAVSSNAATIAKRIDEILQNTTNEIFGDYVFSIRRIQEIAYTEQAEDANEYYKHVGGLYRISIYKL